MKKIIIVFTVLFMIVLIGGCKKEETKTPEIIEEKITVAFNSDGGTSVSEIEITKGESFTLPTTTRDGYKQYIEDNSKVELLNFGIYRTKLAKNLMKYSDIISKRLLSEIEC